MITIKVNIKKTKLPINDNSKQKVEISKQTIKERKEKILVRMKENNLSSIVVYADKEHGSSFEYLVGFIPRFEEALFILNIDGTSTTILGNENYNKTKYSRVETVGIKCMAFSLPNQPMKDITELQTILADIKIDTTGLIGIVGWKLIPGMKNQFDAPQFIIQALASEIGSNKLVNATDLYIRSKKWS